MRKTKFFTIFLGVSLLAISAAYLPDASGYLNAEEQDETNRKGSSYSDQTGLFLKMDKDGNIEYVEQDLSGQIQDTTMPEDVDDSVTFDVEVKTQDGETAKAGSYDTLDQAVKSGDNIKRMRQILRSRNSDVDVSVYSNNLLRATTAPAIVKFKVLAGGATIPYTEVGTGIGGYTSAGYAVDAAYLGTVNGKVKFRMAGVTGLVDEKYVSIETYNSSSKISYYQLSNGNLYHTIYTPTYSSVQRVGSAPSYLKANTKYYSYDGHYFYTAYATMINDYKNGNFNNAVNKGKPFYNYYQFLSMRSQTSFTAANLNTRVTQGTTNKNSKMLNSGADFINAQVYGTNAALAFGLAVNESAWGNSTIAREKNNIFGLNAVDTSPGTSANTFASVSVCIKDFAKNWVSLGYASPTDWRYYGPHFGDKQSGMNVKYASDPYWGEKAAAQSYFLEDISGKKDSDKYTIAVNLGEAPVYVYKDANTSSKQLYRTGNDSGKVIHQFPYIILDTVKNTQGTWYKIRTDGILKSDRSALASVKGHNGIYDYTYNYGYIKADSNITIIKDGNGSVSNEGNPGQVPENTYKKGDVNGDGKVSVLDYIAIENHIMERKKLSGDTLKRADVNSDGKVSVLDYIAIENHIMGRKPLF